MINLLYVDLFCGAGGTSTGVELARVSDEQCAKVVACVNHDKNAIASHAANHPDALHFTEDIRTLELSPLVAHVNRMKQIYPEAHVVLWASLECTNFSKAKGGLPRDADSRTLAEHLFRYIEALNPSYIQIENVEEFMSWGDMDANGKPISKDKGRLYERWKRNVKSYGYEFEHKILNAADYGAFTSRRRFFGQFAAKGLPITWPEPSHCKDGKIDMFCNLEKWRPVKDVLDLQDEGESIFDRKKSLAPKTFERHKSGLIKFVCGGKEQYLIKWNSMSSKGKYVAPGVDEPCPVVSCQNRLGLANVQFLSKYYSGHPDSKNISVDGPAHTIKTKDNHALVSADFLSAYYGTGDNVRSIEMPCATVTTKDRFNYVHPKFLCSYNFKDSGKTLLGPCPTLLTKDRLALVSCNFLDMQYGNSRCSSIEQPAGTVVQNPKHSLITCNRWLMNTSFSNVGSSLSEPSPVVTANRKWHYLVNPQYTSAGGSIDSPCFTLIARMDKRPPIITTCQTEVIGKIPSFVKITPYGIIYEIYEDDLPVIKDIKEIMAMYGIIDIKQRMLKIPELKRIMGFPEKYKLIGTQADQKKFIGNAVEVNMARVLCEAVSRKLRELRKVAA
ncbi:DNA cytosine methyltransferase [Bacteroides ovatus]|jgi:DNA (cytosine-5)-methyltransferase 1|uniref:DNA cytosine methyltransferase n=1 Tax=Bacteroides ovatus TaxID=28116 RepID=UPI0029553941|nr:DNA cytosine methyltransferase [Bacteroides ovatus]MDV7051532.1 DNA cytosine methyltransferase [Bacteroides ovatus]